MLNNIIFENKDKFLAFQKCYKILEITYTIHTSSFLRSLRLEDPTAARLHRVATPIENQLPTPIDTSFDIRKILKS